MNVKELHELAKKVDLEHTAKLRQVVDEMAKSIPTEGLNAEEISVVFYYVFDYIRAEFNLGCSYNVLKAQSALYKAQKK